MAKPKKATKPLAQAEILVSDKRRRIVALEAIYQIAALFDAVKEQSRNISSADDLDAVAVIRALVFRGNALTSAAMIALGDDEGQSADEVKDLENVVDGTISASSETA
jgi:hypothetical protein